MRLVDADALVKAIDGNPFTTDSVKSYIRVSVAKMPTIEERKTGKWIIHETETDRYYDMKCPFCKKSYTVDAYRIDDIGFTAADFNFCPNCGSYNGGDKDALD